MSIAIDISSGVECNRQRAAYQQKFYPIDPGLWRCVTTTTSSNKGKLLEVAVYLALRQQGHEPCYWREGGEVDFVIGQGTSVRPIQVTWDAPANRHEDALEAFYSRFPHAEEAVIITRHNFEQIHDL